MALHVDYEVRWKNYRAFEDTDWITIRPLTVLIGPNNSGKTSVISPMLLLNQTITSRDAITPLVTRGPLIDAGTYRDIIHKQDTTRRLFLGLRFHVHDRTKKLKRIGAYPPGAIEVTFESGQRPGEVLLSRYEIFDIYKRQFVCHDREEDGAYDLSGLEEKAMTDEERFAIRASRPVNFMFSPSRVLYELSEEIGADSSRSTKKFSKGFSDYLEATGYAYESLRGLFASLSYIGPLRDRPRRYYEISGEIPRSVGPHGENTANLLHRRIQRFRGKLNSWIKEFEFGDRLKENRISEELFSLSFVTSRPTTSTNIADAGFGASQVLPLVVQALAAPTGSLTIAEQPEIHLNPRLQCILADLFTSMANNDQRVIVETHSEHLLLRLRRLVASGEINNEKVAIYFVEKSGGVSSIRPIPVKDNGHISPEVWPKGFFGESLRESLALAAEQSRSSSRRRESGDC